MDKVLHAILARDPLPGPIYLVTRTDRSRLANYDLVDVDALRRTRIEALKKAMTRGPLNAEVWMKDVAKVEPYVTRIQSRGGRVVYVRFPTEGEHWEVDQQFTPKSEFWDQMAAFTSAETIHFKDFPTLSHFRLPDSSHLDETDVPAFTSALLDILEGKGILSTSQQQAN